MLWECDWEIFKESVFEILILENVRISMWLDVTTLLDATSRVLKQTQIFVFNSTFWSSRVVINLLLARHLTIMTKTNDCNIKSNEINSIKITNNIILTKKSSTMLSMWYKNIIEKILTSRDLDETLRRSWVDSKNVAIIFYNNVNIVTHREKVMLRKYFDFSLHEFEHLINFQIFEFEFWI